MCIRDSGVPSDLLSTDARCQVILLGGQCNRPMVDFTARRYAKRGICRRHVSVRPSANNATRQILNGMFCSYRISTDKLSLP